MLSAAQQLRPELLRNLALRLVKDAVTEHGQDAFTYEVAIHQRSADFLERHLRQYGLNLVYEAVEAAPGALPASIHVPFVPPSPETSRVARLQLPSGRELIAGFVAYDPAYVQLFALRRRVAGALAEYRIVRDDNSGLFRRGALLVARA